MVENLKGKNHPLIYYRSVKEDIKIEKTRMKETKDGSFKEFYYYDTVTNKIIFEEEKVKEFSLDEHGKNIEFEDRQFTIIHNYLIRFWQHFIKADGLALLVTLKSRCIDKDYCWPSLQTLQYELGFGSVNTVKKKLAVLESYGFVFRFNCMIAEHSTGVGYKNQDESPIIKVRRRVPFLPKELYDSLPEELKTNHDTFMEKYMSITNPDNLGKMIKYEEIYEDFLEKGEPLARKPVKKKSRNHTKDLEALKSTLTTQDEEITSKLLAYLETKLSKPSFDTWFKSCMIKIREDVVTLYASNRFAADWINDRHKDLVSEGLLKLGINPIDIKIVSMEN